MAATSARRNRIRLTDDFDGVRLRRARVAGPRRRREEMERTMRNLAPGDAVAVVATGFAVHSRALREGIAVLHEMGFEVHVGAHILGRHGYLAGTDAERASDLNAALRRRTVRAVWFARGGYGTARILDRIDWTAYENDPKPLLGYSDLTALFAGALRVRGASCFYAPVVSELGDPRAYHRPSLRAALEGKGWSLSFGRAQVIVHGRAEGRLVGGNLTVLSHLLGTRHAADLGGGILFLEDVGEEVYRLDRMLTQLRASGALDGVAGVLLGDLSAPRPARRFPPDRPLRDVLEEAFVPLGVPVVGGVRAGHRPGKRTLPLGARVRIDTTAGVVEGLSLPGARRA